MTTHIKPNLLFLMLLIVFYGFAHAESPVRSLFNESNFIEEGRPFVTERFWSNPSNTLYGKAVADWKDEDFNALDMELRKTIYSLSLSSNPFRNAHIDKLQRAVDLVPSFKLWAKRGMAGQLQSEPGSPTASGQSGFSGKLLRYGLKYGVPGFGVALVLGGAAALGFTWRKRIQVSSCPKCKTKEKKMLSVGTRTFKSLFLRGKRKCYCAACGYKWIQR